MQLSCQTLKTLKKFLFLFLLSFAFITSKAHNVTSYTSGCNIGPTYSVQPNVNSVNNNSNYAWQYKNGGTWVCILNGNNTINGNTYNVTGASYTGTTNPGPIIFTNPNNSLQNLEIRCLISDGANPCNMPNGNTWTSATNHFINVTGTPCSCNNVTDPGSIGNNETICGVSFDPANIVSLALPTGGSGTIEYVWLVSTNAGNNYSVIPGANTSSYDPGVITQTTWYRRCARRAGCSDFVGESNWVMKELTNCCNNVTDGGLIGYDEVYCGVSFNPANIVNVTLPTGGSGTLEYVWLVSTDGGSTYTVIPSANANSYDPGVITQTTWYRRCARRAGCAGYIGETPWIKKELCPIPTANAGSTKNLNCTTTYATIGTATVVGNTYSWVPGTGLNQTNVAQPTASPNATTIYTVTVGNACGCTATSTVTVNVNTTPPTANAGPDRDLNCNINSTVIGSPAVAGNTYAWLPATGLVTATSAQPSVFIVTSLTYTVTVTAANGCTATDVVVVTVNTTPPTANAGPDKNLNCITTFATIGTQTVAGYTYAWLPNTGLNNTNTAQPTASPNATTIYTVTVTSANGCTATSTVTVNVNTTPPTADGGPDKIITCLVPSAQIGVAAVAGNTYSWLPANGLDAINIAQPTATPTSNTNYTVTVTSANGCSATDVITVTVNKNNPVANAGPNKNLNCTITSATIGTAVVAGNTYSWTPGNGLNQTNIAQPTASPNATTVYTLTVTSANGCSATSTVTVNVNTTPPTADAGPDKNLNCTTTSEIIGTLAIAGNTYLWTPGNGLSFNNIAQPTASPNVTTTYTVTVTSANGCTATDVVTVNVNTTPPTADAGPDKNLNCTTTSEIIGTLAIAGNTYLWTPGNGLSFNNIAQPIASPNVTTTYTVTVTSANGCTATDVVTVNVNTTPPTADAGPDKTIDCHITTVSIGSISIVGNSYSWMPSLTLDNATIAEPNATPLVNTSYTVTVTSANGCTASDVVLVDINQVPPTVVITGNMEVCNGSTTTITASGTQATYLWNTGASTASIIVSAGTYIVTATDGVCINTASATVSTVQGTIGNYVWNDINLDGIQNELGAAGINSVTVQLYDAGPDMSANTIDDILLQTTTTNNDANNNPGYYNFIVCNSGNYFVKFPSTVGELITTIQTPTAGVDLNSDINNAGFSPVFNIDVHGIGVAKDNNTIDAGYIALKYIGNYVWNDINRDGIQNNNEVGVSGITVTLLDNNSATVASTVTDAYGKYYFNSMLGGQYKISFTLPPGFVFSPKDNAANDELDSDVDPTTGITDVFTYITGTIDLSFDAGIYLPIPTKAEVGDRVWLDINQNGIQDLTETGIAGVTVTLFDNNNLPVAYTITDANGNYQFTNLDPATYSVGFTLPIGYIYSPATQGGDSEKDSNPNISTGRTTPFNLAAGEINHSIDAGMYSQPPGLQLPASLGNFVWNDVNNNGIQDQNEAGVAGVTVHLHDSTGVNIIATTYTDIFGNYIFNNLKAGSYKVEFTNIPNGFNLVSPLAGNDIAKDSDPNPATGQTDFITLLPGELNTTIDAGLHNSILPIGSIGNYVWFDRNNDGIQDANENGVGGVTVKLYNTADVLLNTTITNNDGYYIFNNLDADNYYLNFSNLPLGYKLTLPLEGIDINKDSNPTIANGNTGVVALSLGETNLTIDAGLVASNGRNNKGSIGDIVWNDLNNNGIQDVEELGVQGITVTLYQANGISVITSTQTDPLGNYIFTDLDEGSYIVGFSNLPIGFTFSQARQGNDTEIDADVDASTGGKSNLIVLGEGDIDLTIDAGIHQAAGLAGLGDRVWNDLNQDGLQDANEPGIPGVTVQLFDNNGIAIANTTTDANGIYQFNGLNPGTYKVKFSNLPTGYDFTIANLNGSQESLDSDADPLTGETSFVTLLAGEYNPDVDAGIFTLKASLGNYVWEDINKNGIQDANEKGISGVVVNLYDGNNVAVSSAITNSVGQYNFVNLEPGDYIVQFTNIPVAGTFSPQYAGNDTTMDSNVGLNGYTDLITLTPSQYNPTLDAGIHLPTGAGLGNYVWLDLDEDGIQDANEPGIPGVTVTLYDSLGVAINSTITTQFGAYSFNDLIPGTYSVGFSTLPTYYQPGGNPYSTYFTKKHIGANDDADNDADATGKTAQYTIAIGEYNPTVDAGIFFGFPLPALELKASANLIENNNVNVSWITNTEINTSIFEIERSTDNNIFEKVATQNASGNTTGITNYAIKDDISKLTKGDVIFYRVKLIDIDGKSYYSNTVNVKLISSDIDATVYPSPFSNNLNILYTSDVEDQINVSLIDMNGRVIYNDYSDLKIGKNVININNLDNLATGIYSIQIIAMNSNVKTYFKVIKN